MPDASRDLDIFVIAGEESGDQLGAHLMDALAERAPGGVRFRGVGGPRMADRGLASRFPMSDIALFGITSIIAHIPTILRRVRETVEALNENPPDALVLIDCPGFTRRVGRAIRKLRPDIPIVFYVSPSVWAWRPGRAAEMRPYVDHLLALLPFEPAIHKKLGGPPTTYVGHPISERIADLRPNAEEQARRAAGPPQILVLPGSRRLEIQRLSPLFAGTIAKVADMLGPIDLVLPAVPRLRGLIDRTIADWPVKPRVVEGEEEKFAAFRTARAALACSGTVTLELAVAGIPQVVAYRTGWLEAQIARRLITAETAVLANLVLGETVVPEFLQEFGSVETVAPALAAVIRDTPQRKAQLAAFGKLDKIMGFGGEDPSHKAAKVVLDTIARRRGRGAKG
jgi:lipid-A-disaccharide synthase